MVLTDTVDPYCWPGSNVLRNMLGLRTESELAEAEYDFTLERRVELDRQPVRGDFSLDHLRAIHRHLFQDVFDWAGELRTVNISKEKSNFLPRSRFNTAAGFVFQKLHDGPLLRGRTIDDDDFLDHATDLLDGINYIHPFREGNGRTQRAFLDQVADASKRKLSWRNVADVENNVASAVAVTTGTTTQLRSMLVKVLRPPIKGVAGFDLDAYRVTSAAGETEPANSTLALCRRCGRPLTSPESVARGFGAGCWKHRNS